LHYKHINLTEMVGYRDYSSKMMRAVGFKLFDHYSAFFNKNLAIILFS